MLEELLVQPDRVTMTVFQTSRQVGDLRKEGCPHLYVEEHVTDASGWYSANTDLVKARLKGRFARVWNHSLHTDNRGQCTYVGNRTFDWNAYLGIRQTEPPFKDLMAYYHVTNARLDFDRMLASHSFGVPGESDWYKELSVIVDLDGTWEGNCWWDAHDRRIVIGRDSDFALDSLVTYHEYAHAMMDLIAPNLFVFYEEEGLSWAARKEQRSGQALCEALADYMACAVKGYPKILEEWPECARNLEVSYRVDLQNIGEPHMASKALSSGLWELRNECGPPSGPKVVDRWVWEALYLQRNRPCGMKMFGLDEAVRLFVDIDVTRFQGKNVDKIVAVFKERGLGSLLHA